MWDRDAGDGLQSESAQQSLVPQFAKRLRGLTAPGLSCGGQCLSRTDWGSPTGPSWETVCMLNDSSWPGFCSSSRRLEKALAIILLFLIRFGSSSLCPVNLRRQRWGWLAGEAQRVGTHTRGQQ